MTNLATLQALPSTAGCPHYLREAIEQQWRAREEMQRFPPSNAKRLQVEFFIGACAVLDTLGYAPPTAWVDAIHRNARIV